MIRWKDGKVFREYMYWTASECMELADALDVAVAKILAIEVAAKAARISGIAVLCRMAIHKIGADHAED